MALSDIDHRLFVQRLVSYFEVMSGEQWERFGHRIAEVFFGETLTHRGQTISGKPIGYTVDSVSESALRVAEYTTEENVFVDFKKPGGDYDHVRRLHPHTREILLLSNRVVGPDAATNVDNWEYEITQRDGITVALLGAREIAERIADQVIPDRMLVERIAPYLEPLRHLEAEFAATNLVPPIPVGAVRRPTLERELLGRLNAARVVVLAGMSGLGKSLTAIALANDERSQRAVIWVEELQITSIRDLEAVDVAQRGILLPLVGMLRTRPCLLVLDDLRCQGNIDELAAALHKACGEGSAVLITTQLAASDPVNVDMPFANDAEAAAILEYGVKVTCPEDLRARIVRSAGRLPLALALLNGSANEGVDWESLTHDADRIAELAVAEKATRLADVLVQRWRNAIDGGLRVFLWAGAPRLHEGFYRRLATNNVVTLIRRLRFTDDGTADTHRLHDIAWAAVQNVHPAIAVDEARLGQMMEDYVQELSTRDAWTQELNHFARLHAPLLDRLVKSGTFGPGALYAWLHFPGRRDLGEIPDAVLFAREAASDAANTFRVQTASELAEAIGRLSIAEARKNGISLDGELLLLPFDILLKAKGLSSEGQFHVRHHRAKTLKRLGRYEEAVAECDLLLREAGPLPATRLLVARTLTEGFLDDPSAGARARQLLLGLIDEAAANRTSASVSVTLAAAELLRRRVVQPNWHEIFTKYGEFLGEVIVAANERGLEQSILTLAGLASDWSECDSPAFAGVVRSLPPSPPDRTLEEEELAAWGEVFAAMAVAEPWNRDRHLAEALSYFSQCAKVYGLTHRAHILTQLGRPNDSLAVLNVLAETYPRNANDRWVLQRRAEALSGLGDHEAALECSTQAVSGVKVGERHFKYLWQVHARILEIAGKDDEARAALQLAVESEAEGCR